jgi:hypothetical protein
MSKQIMIVDDSMTMRKMVTFALQSQVIGSSKPPMASRRSHGYQSIRRSSDYGPSYAGHGRDYADQALRKLDAYRSTPILVLTLIAAMRKTAEQGGRRHQLDY